MKVYRRLDSIPRGNADPDALCDGCLVLEGGAFRGLYTQGALDALMMADVNAKAVIGVSAGAMSGLTYASGQIGRSARINLGYRHDGDYIGPGAFRRDHGITGFTFAFRDYDRIEPLDRKTLHDPRRRFVAVATDVDTGEATYLEKGKCSDILKAIQASATVPYVSEPVELDGRRYLDGGIAQAIPVDWALSQGFGKVLVIRTRDRAYRKAEAGPDLLIDAEYGRHPALARALKAQHSAYNAQADHVDDLESQGRIMVLAPARPVEIARFEGDMDKLGALYWRGFDQATAMMPEIKAYFGIS